MKSFLCVRAQQNYALMLADKRAFALPPKEDFRMLLRSLTALFVREPYLYTTETLGKELGKQHYAKGLLIRALNILWFVGTNVSPNQEN